MLVMTWVLDAEKGGEARARRNIGRNAVQQLIVRDEGIAGAGLNLVGWPGINGRHLPAQ